MSDLLTHEEYKAIAADLSLPVNAFINGKFTASKSGNTMDSLNPATGVLLGKVAACDSEDVDYAVTKAREAFDRRVVTIAPERAQTGHDSTRQAHQASSP